MLQCVLCVVPETSSHVRENSSGYHLRRGGGPTAHASDHTPSARRASDGLPASRTRAAVARAGAPSGPGTGPWVRLRTRRLWAPSAGRPEVPCLPRPCRPGRCAAPGTWQLANEDRAESRAGGVVPEKSALPVKPVTLAVARVTCFVAVARSELPRRPPRAKAMPPSRDRAQPHGRAVDEAPNKWGLRVIQLISQHVSQHQGELF